MTQETVEHIVGRWEHVLDRLRVKIPRALCGDSLAGDAETDAPPGSPPCPACLAALPAGVTFAEAEPGQRQQGGETR